MMKNLNYKNRLQITFIVSLQYNWITGWYFRSKIFPEFLFVLQATATCQSLKWVKAHYSVFSSWNYLKLLWMPFTFQAHTLPSTLSLFIFSFPSTPSTKVIHCLQDILSFLLTIFDSFMNHKPYLLKSQARCSNFQLPDSLLIEHRQPLHTHLDNCKSVGLTQQHWPAATTAHFLFAH